MYVCVLFSETVLRRKDKANNKINTQNIHYNIFVLYQITNVLEYLIF